MVPYIFELDKQLKKLDQLIKNSVSYVIEVADSESDIYIYNLI